MDARLVSIGAGLWLGAWTVTAWGLRWNLVWLSVWLLVWCLLLLALRKFISIGRIQVSRFLLVFFSSFVVGVVLGAIRVWPILDNPLRAEVAQGSIVSVVGIIDGDPVVKQDYVRTRIRVDQVSIHGVTHRVRVPASLTVSEKSAQSIVASLVPGTKISVVGKVYAELPGRVSAAGIRAVSDPQVLTAPPNYQAWASGLRQGLHQSVRGYWSDAAALVPGLTLGDVSRVPTELNNAMKSSGLSHLVAVSGTNVTLLLALVLTVLRRYQVSRTVTIGTSLSVLAIFVLVVRPQPSVLRATAMGVVSVIALYMGGKRTAMPTLLVAAIALLFVDPWLATSYGFALSVAATAGLVMWARRVMEFLDDQLPRKYPQWLLEALALTISAQFAVLPMMVAMGATMSFASIPANVIAAPLAGLVLMSGLVVSLLAPLSPGVAHIFAAVPALSAQLIAMTARTCAKFTALAIPWPSGAVGIVIAVVSVGFVLYWSTRWRSFESVRRNVVVTICSTLALLMWVHPLGSLKTHAPAGWIMMSCDVGQGDASILKTAEHEAIVVDVGGDPDAIDRCLNQAEIRTIPLLVLTHFHADHVGGLEGVFRKRNIHLVKVTELQDPLITTTFALNVLRLHNMNWSVWKYPEVIRVGDLMLSSIWPSREIRGQGSDANNASIGLVVTSPRINLLLPGDMEPPAQDAAISILAPMHIDVEKVPHHGSKYQSRDFAVWASPKIAIISVGKDNDYGHPAQSTIDLYRAVGATVVRTDQLGSIYVVSGPGTLSVVTR